MQHLQAPTMQPQLIKEAHRVNGGDDSGIRATGGIGTQTMNVSRANRGSEEVHI